MKTKVLKTARTLSRCDGIHAFCITIVEEARDYLLPMYAAANTMVIDDIDSVTVQASDIYQGLTG